MSHNQEVTPRELANSICETLRDQGYHALLCGGCVRDLLRGCEPKDYDIATDARPGDVLQLFPRALTVGAQFGVVVVLEREAAIEVATPVIV